MPGVPPRRRVAPRRPRPAGALARSAQLLRRGGAAASARAAPALDARRVGLGSRRARAATAARAGGDRRLPSTSTGAFPAAASALLRRTRRRSTTSCSRCAQRATRGRRRARAGAIRAARASRSRSRTTSTRRGAGARRGLLRRRVRGSRRALADGDCRRRAPRGDRSGAGAAAPPARQRPQLVARPLRRPRAPPRLRSTCFVLAAHRDPHDGAAPEAYAERRAAARDRARPSSGSRSGCTRATRCLAERSADRRRARRRSRALLGGPVAGNRHHYLRLPWHDGHPRARPARLRATTRRSATPSAPGARAGLSFPFRALGPSRPARRCASSSCRSS